MKKILNLIVMACVAGLFLTACGGEATDSSTGTTTANNTPDAGSTDADGDDSTVDEPTDDADPDDAASTVDMNAAWFSPNQVQDMMYEDEEKAIGKTITVKGSIGKVWEYADSQEPVVSFADAEDAEYFIIDCVFADAAATSSLKVGQDVEISGTIEALEIGTVVLKNCSVK